jgi:signal peptidase I
VRSLVRAWWFILAPLFAAMATLRWLVPPPAESGPGPWGRLAEAGARHGLLLGVILFVLFAAAARLWRDRLPGARQLASAEAEQPRAPRSLPQRITAGASVVLAALAALTLRARVGELYAVSGPSMLPTLLPGDTLVVSKLDRRSLRRGDLVSFRQAGAEEPMVKRIIGLPGDRITMRAGIPIINGWEVPHCDAGTYVRYAANGTLVGRLLVEFLEDRVFLAVHVPGTKSFAGYQVAPGEVFVLGDDRSNSEDSRAWNEGRGAGVRLSAVEGRPWRVIGTDIDGRVDLRRVLERPGVQLRMPGMDLRGLQSGLDRCLSQRPTQTWPPPAGAS